MVSTKSQSVRLSLLLKTLTIQWASGKLRKLVPTMFQDLRNFFSKFTIKSGPRHRSNSPAKVKNRNVNSELQIHILTSKPG